jgi:hypothetical protein
MELRRAVVQKNLKLIRVGERPDELFDLEADPGEMHNLLEERPLDVARLDREIDALVRLTDAQRSGLTAGEELSEEMDEGVLHRLRGLGYID